MNNSYVHVNMTREWSILIFTTISLVFHLTNSQPSTLNLSLQEQCRTGNGSLVRLNNFNDSGSLTELLIRPMWSSVDGNFTPWIAYIGCFDAGLMPAGYIHQNEIILNNTVERCYLECHKENISCRQNKPIYSALRESLCFCLCQIQGLISPSNKCNGSCSPRVNCSNDNCFNVYTEYAMENKGSDEFCLVCSKAESGANPNAMLSCFGCDGESFGRCVKMVDDCYGIKEDKGNLNFSNTDCTQQLPYYCWKYNEIITNYNGSEVISTTVDQSSEFTSTSAVHTPENTLNTIVQSSELNPSNPHEVSSSISPLNSSLSFNKATTSRADTVGAIVGLLIAVFALTSLVLILWFYKTKRNGKHRDSQIALHQPHTSQTVNHTYTDMMLVPGANQTQNDVTFTTTTNDVRNDDIYVENEDREYDHLHSSRPKLAVSEREDERYEMSTQLEDVSYSTVRKSRKSVPDRDNEYDSMSASLDNNFLSVANPDYDFCYQSSQRKDC